MKNLFVFLLLTLMGSGAHCQNSPGVKLHPPIIDMHMHTGLFHEVPAGAPAICRPEPCQGEGRSTANPAENLKKTLEQMDHYNIVKGFLSGVDLAVVGQWVNAAPGRFIASPFILKK